MRNSSFLKRSLILSAAISGITFAHADVVGGAHGIFIKNGLYSIPVAACVEGTNLKPTISFTANGISLGTIVPNETSEPEMAAFCNNTATDLRAVFTIPSNYYSSIVGHPIQITASYPGYTSGTFVNSNVFSIPSNYSSHPMAVMQSASKILFMGAHADDEIHASIVLSELCHQSGTECTFLIATGGDHTVRSAEMITSAEFFDAVLYHEPLNEAQGSKAAAIASWSSELGQDVHIAMANFITSVDPDYIITLDPRHGNYGCNYDHWAVSQTVIDAVDYMSFPETQVFFATQVAQQDPNAHPEILNLDLDPSASNSWAYSGDSAAVHPYVSGINTSWDHFMELFHIHDSQFSSVERERIKRLHWNGMQWVGNDSSGRLMTLQRMDHFSFSDEPHASYCF